MTASAVDVHRMWLIIAFLRRHGVRVVEVSGWQHRGVALPFQPRMFVSHWDASSRRSGEWGALGIVVAGRGGANPVPGPLAQTQIPRCLNGVPTVAIVAAGRANHAGAGGPYRLPDGTVIPRNSANRYALCTEHANDGIGEPVTPASMLAYQTLAAAHRSVLGSELRRGVLPVGTVVAHSEWAPQRKSDPRTYIAAIRSGSSRVLAGPTPTPAPPKPPEDEMAGSATEIMTKLDDIHRLETVGDGANVAPEHDTHPYSMKTLKALAEESRDGLVALAGTVSALQDSVNALIILVRSQGAG